MEEEDSNEPSEHTELFIKEPQSQTTQPDLPCFPSKKNEC